MMPASAAPVVANWLLADVLAEHDLAGELVPQPRLLQRLARRAAIGGDIRIGDGKMRTLTTATPHSGP